MRELIEQEIIHNFNRGIDEVEADRMNDCREIQLPGTFYDKEDRVTIVTDIEKYLSNLYDAELLVVLRSQHCQLFR